MTYTIAATKDTILALDAVIKLLSVLNLTTNDRTVLANALPSDITEPQGEADAQDTADSPSGSSSGNDKEPAHIESTTRAVVDSKPTVTFVVTVMDKDVDLAEVKDVMAEGCILHTYRHVCFNILVASDAAPPFYYVTRGRKIGVFSGWGNVSPKVLGVSHAIFAKVETIDQGIEALMAAIDAGTAAQCLVAN
ncbi:uncharacterized protein EDB93DRAFT_1107519 [Suillus bovinus]|uniref:uncharacterized protein n=1 Tax=Suillus bovinus TaxID=48563 RepID=UPI001B884EF5|nr:uncharacterized protein EDB93DRAFT_1107519 [Suillus bovinus]KAG2133685.1 hypothetical protein EDB93DRAFT_1107519 [Suillus bovinus]